MNQKRRPSTHIHTHTQTLTDIDKPHTRIEHTTHTLEEDVLKDSSTVALRPLPCLACLNCLPCLAFAALFTFFFIICYLSPQVPSLFLSSSLFSPFLTSFFTLTPILLHSHSRTLSLSLSLLLLPFKPLSLLPSHHHSTSLHTPPSSSLIPHPPSNICILQYNKNNNLPLLSFENFYLCHSN